MENNKIPNYFFNKKNYTWLQYMEDEVMIYKTLEADIKSVTIGCKDIE